jgi:hypothetical protein
MDRGFGKSTQFIEMGGPNQRVDNVGIPRHPDHGHFGPVGAIRDTLSVFADQVVVKQHHIDALSLEYQQGFVSPGNTDDLVVFAESFAKEVTDRGLSGAVLKAPRSLLLPTRRDCAGIIKGYETDAAVYRAPPRPIQSPKG